MGRHTIATQVQMLMAGGFMLVVVAFGYLAWDKSQRGPVIISTDPTLVEIVVEVRGEVVRPGVYTLPEDGRVGQLIELAGGVTAEADLRTVNLARRLADEEVVVVPSKAAATPVGSATARDPAQAGNDSRVNVNSASAAQLEALPGIGEVLAGRIVAYREANGPFSSVEDLAKVDGISDSLVDELRELVTVGP